MKATLVTAEAQAEAEQETSTTKHLDLSNKSNCGQKGKSKPWHTGLDCIVHRQVPGPKDKLAGWNQRQRSIGGVSQRSLHVVDNGNHRDGPDQPFLLPLLLLLALGIDPGDRGFHSHPLRKKLLGEGFQRCPIDVFPWVGSKSTCLKPQRIACSLIDATGRQGTLAIRGSPNTGLTSGALNEKALRSHERNAQKNIVVSKH